MAGTGANYLANSDDVGYPAPAATQNTVSTPAVPIAQPPMSGHVSGAVPCGGAGSAPRGDSTGYQLPWMRGPRPAGHTGALGYQVPVPKAVGQQASVSRPLADDLQQVLASAHYLIIHRALLQLILALVP